MVRRCFGCMTEYESKYGICPCCGYEPDTSAESPLHIQPGTQLTNRYLVGKVLGYGGFGVTYLAWDSVLNQRVAIKEYLPSEFATRMAGESKVSVFGGNKAEQFADGLIKFVDEARRLAKFQNEDGIVRVLDSFESNNTAYIVMEYLEGETLTAFLEREGTVPLGKAMDWLEPVVRSLETVHQAGIIHRDIAPDNIFLTTDGRIKLIDFGAARYATTSHSRSLTIIIKPGYSPEEQYRSRGAQGPHTDVYALAAVLYRMITGVTPPDALERRAVLENKKKDILEPPSKHCKLDSSMENAILNAMNVQAEDRTETVLALWNELTSAEPVKRRGNKVRALDLARWPLGLKIALPIAGVLAVTLLSLLLSGRLGFVNSLARDIMLGEGMTRVPSVINYSIGAAQEMLDNQQLTPVISGRQQSAVIPTDLVLTQSISAGQVVEKNTPVELYISAPLEALTEAGHAPDVMYFTEEEALAQFREWGIEPKVEYEYSDDVAAGLVIGQSVMGGDSLEEGHDVTLTVSLGPNPAASEDENKADGTVALKINRSALSLYIGDAVTLSASGGSGTYQWSSSAPEVVTVRNGAVTAVGRGKAVIMVTSGNERVACPVTVREYSLTMSQARLSLSKGNSMTLSVSGAPSGAAISWSSNNTSVATVRNGQVTAVGAGNATITAKMTYGGRDYTATCSVSVMEEVTGSVYLSQSVLTLIQGDSNTITATVLPSGQAVTWSSSDTSVATVSNGRITAVGAGTATITARISYNGQTYMDTCAVTVTPQPGSLSIYLETLELKVGETESLLTMVSPSGQTVTWSSSNSSVATVSNGVVTAKAAGTTTITARMTYGGKTYTDTCAVTVTALPEGSLSITPKSLELEAGETYSLIYMVSPAGDIAVTWSSSNTSVATVSNGRVTAKATGTATITARMTYGGKTYTDTCQVTVTSAWSGLSIMPKSVELKDGEIYNLSYTIPPRDASVSWTSNNYAVADVEKGQITAVGVGTAIITAHVYYNGETYTDTCTVTVVPDPTKVDITLSFPSYSLQVGWSFTIHCTTFPSGQTVTWSSSDNSVATVYQLSDENNGALITAISPGTATITASMTYNGQTYTDTCQVTVTVAAGISLNRSSMTISKSDITAGGHVLVASTTPKGQSVSWSSSDPSVATVRASGSSISLDDWTVMESYGAITMVGPGKTIITASMTYNGQTYTATCEVTVT